MERSNGTQERSTFRRWAAVVGLGGVVVALLIVILRGSTDSPENALAGPPGEVGVGGRSEIDLESRSDPAPSDGHSSLPPIESALRVLPGPGTDLGPSELSVRLTRTPGWGSLFDTKIELKLGGELGEPIEALADAASATWSQLPPGTYQLSADGGGWGAGPIVIELVGLDREVELELTPSHWVSGLVVDAITAGPLERFTVQSQRGVYTGDTVGIQHMASDPVEHEDPGGRFQLGGLQDWGDAFRLRITAEGHEPAFTEWLRKGELRDDLRIELLRSERAGWTVRGRVFDADGAAASGAAVVVVTADAGPSSIARNGELLWVDGNRIVGRGSSDPGRAVVGLDGSFELAGLDLGRARVVIHGAGHTLHWSDEVAPHAGQVVDLRDIQLERGASLRGVVVVDPSSDLVPLGVRAEGLEGGGSSCELDHELRFEIAGLEPGLYRVSVEAELPLTFDGTGGARMPLGVEVIHVEPFETRELTLTAGIELRGRRVDGRLQELDPRFGMFAVFLLEGDEHPVRRGVLGSDGRFSLRDVEPGSYVLVAAASSEDFSVLAVVMELIEVDPVAGAGPLEVPLSGARVRGRGAKPGQTATLLARTGVTALDRFLAVGSLATDAEGALELIGLPRGSYSIELDGRSTAFEIEDDQATLTLDLGTQ